jgi:TatD DNase family protein
MSDNKKEYYFIDTHAHLGMLKGKTPEKAVEDAEKEGIRYIINVGTSLEDSRMSIDFSNKFTNVFASIGMHPHDASGFGKKEEFALEVLVMGRGDESECSTENNSRANIKKKHGRIVAIGETGFDFYRNLSPKKDQEKAFISQIELAIRYDLPIIIHDRDAHNDTLRVLKKYAGNKNFRAVMHCFSGDSGFAEKCLDLGLFISFTGVVTFPSAKSVAEAASVVPIDRIFLETDSPFLAPQAKRGKENYPEYVKYVAGKIAEIKKLSIEEIAFVTSKNAEKFFSLNRKL